jgi:transcriptional regulator with XRE-family HTH domain
MTGRAASETASDIERNWLLDVGMRVRLARVRARESQGELATRAGVSRVTVGSIERADHPAVVLAYRRLAEALGLPLAELLDGAL